MRCVRLLRCHRGRSYTRSAPDPPGEAVAVCVVGVAVGAGNFDLDRCAPGQRALERDVYPQALELMTRPSRATAQHAAVRAQCDPTGARAVPADGLDLDAPPGRPRLRVGQVVGP